MYFPPGVAGPDITCSVGFGIVAEKNVEPGIGLHTGKFPVMATFNSNKRYCGN